jgi:hypothetical protein
MVFCDSISREGNRGVPGGVRSQSKSFLSFSELRKSSAPVLRAGAGVDDEILNIGEVPGFEPNGASKSSELFRRSSFRSFSRFFISRNNASSSSFSFITETLRPPNCCCLCLIVACICDSCALKLRFIATKP